MDLTIPCSNATLLRDNMPGHSFNPSYSDEDLLNFVRNGKSIPAPKDQLSELRMTKLSLLDVFPVPISQPSFRCKGVKRYRRRNLVMIGYNMRAQDNINFEEAKIKFEHFLARHLGIDESNVVIEGITSGTDTWYIMNGTPALKKALNISERDLRILALGGVPIVAALLIIYIKYQR